MGIEIPRNLCPRNGLRLYLRQYLNRRKKRQRKKMFANLVASSEWWPPAGGARWLSIEPVY